MKEVTQQEFYDVIGKKDVHPSVVGQYPYTSEFKTPMGTVVGKVVGSYKDGHMGITEKKYFLK